MRARHESVGPSLFPGFVAVLWALAAAGTATAQIGTVASEQKISATQGGFGSGLEPQDLFGHSVAALGDLDGDGNEELAVGASRDDDGGTDKGAVWILFLNSDGTVASKTKISDTAGRFGGALDANDRFGASLASLGDLDGDGVGELAVGASLDDDGGADQGAVWILFLNSDGTVASEQKISETAGGFGGDLHPGDAFGMVASLGDLDGDGNDDLAVGSDDDDGGIDQGAVWILFLNPDGTVASETKISETSGGFGGDLDQSDHFGFSVASPGDLDGDGNADLAVGAIQDDDGGGNQGAVWILFLNSDGTVASEQKVSETSGGFGGHLDVTDSFGIVAPLGDLDGDGNADLAVGAVFDDDGGMDRGAIWILFLNSDGTVASEQKISETSGGFGGDLDRDDRFGASIASLGDLNDDGREDLAVGAVLDSDGGFLTGAVWILFMDDNVHDNPKVQRNGTGPAVLPAQVIVPFTASLLGEPGSHGGVSLRNGSGMNEIGLGSAATPWAGEEWQVRVDVSAHPAACASLVWVAEHALTGRASGHGELLVDLHGLRALAQSLVISSGGIDVHSFAIPLAALGRSFSVQALILDRDGSALLTNALDLVVGTGRR